MSILIRTYPELSELVSDDPLVLVRDVVSFPSCITTHKETKNAINQDTTVLLVISAKI